MAPVGTVIPSGRSQLPDTRKRLAVLGFDPVENTPEQSTTYIKVEFAKWAAVIKESGAKVD